MPNDTITQCNFNHRIINNGTWDNTKYRIISYQYTEPFLENYEKLT